MNLLARELDCTICADLLLNLLGVLLVSSCMLSVGKVILIIVPWLLLLLVSLIVLLLNLLLYCLLIHRSFTLIRVHSDTSPLILGSMALELRSLLVTIVRRHLIV